MVVGKKKRMKERMRKGGESEVGRTVVGKKKERMRERMRMGNGGERIVEINGKTCSNGKRETMKNIKLYTFQIKLKKNL